MGSTSVLKKLGDKSKNYLEGIKSLAPGESEFQGLKEVQNNVDNSSPKATPVAKEVANTETSHSNAKYGDKPGEERIDVSNMLKPLGSTLPSYDEGGDVPEDQVAVVHKDEKVLPPEEAEQYREEHGAPADFGGRVLPNPKGLKPILDTDIKPEVDRIGGGAKMNIDNANIGEGDKDNSTFPTAIAHESNAKELRPYGDVVKDKQKVEEEKSENTPEAPRGTPEERAAIQADKKNAMGQGVSGLTQLGLANLHEKLLAPAGLNGGPTSDQEPATTGPGLPALGGKETNAPAAAPAPLDRKATLANYDKQIQAALDEATPEGQEKADRLSNAKQEYIHRNPWGSADNHPGILGKLGHAAEKVGARLPIISSVVNQIPGSEGQNNEEHNATLGRIQSDTPLNTARDAEEKKANPVPKPFPGDNLRTAADGTREHLYNNPDGSTQWVKEGEAPAWPAKSPTTGAPAPATGAATGAPVPAAKIGDQPNVAAAASTAPQYTYGKPPVPKEGDQPATTAQLNDVTARLNNNPYIPKSAMQGLQFPTGYNPTQNDVKERLANIKEIEDATRQGKQDETNNAIRKLQEENSNLMTKAHLQDMQDKHAQLQEKNAQASTVAMAGLYAQDNYKDAMEDWYKSGNFAKDSGLITEIVNKEHSDKGAFSSVVGDALVGSMFGPEGTAVGAGVGALTGLFSGPANGYLDTLKKQGISPQGYDAMQSYFNALPARFAYEVGVQGLSATALRSSQLIQKVLNTVPPPNTPQEVFDTAFKNYYKPMEVLTKGKIKLTAPPGYTPPAKTDFYPPKEKPAASTAPKGATSEVYGKDGKTLIGHVVDNKYVAIPAAK